MTPKNGLVKLQFRPKDKTKPYGAIKVVTSIRQPGKKFSKQLHLTYIPQGKTLNSHYKKKITDALTRHWRDIFNEDPPGIDWDHALRESKLSSILCEKFGLKSEQVHVVYDKRTIPQLAARCAFDILIKEWRDRTSSGLVKPLGVGIGPGLVTALFSKSIGKLLSSRANERPRLNLFSLTGGAPADNPNVSPIWSFNEFGDAAVDTIGLFAPNLVKVEEFDNIQRIPGVREAFSRKGDIYLIVTSMGDAEYKHDLFAQFLSSQGKKYLDALRERGYVGNIQYRPYSNDGSAVREREGEYRPVTLFEFDEITKLANSGNNHVLLIAIGKGSKCIQPLLKSERKVFTTIIMDTYTAKNALA